MFFQEKRTQNSDSALKFAQEAIGNKLKIYNPTIELNLDGGRGQKRDRMMAIETPTAQTWRGRCFQFSFNAIRIGTMMTKFLNDFLPERENHIDSARRFGLELFGLSVSILITYLEIGIIWHERIEFIEPDSCLMFFKFFWWCSLVNDFWKTHMKICSATKMNKKFVSSMKTCTGENVPNF